MRKLIIVLSMLLIIGGFLHNYKKPHSISTGGYYGPVYTQPSKPLPSNDTDSCPLPPISPTNIPSFMCASQTHSDKYITCDLDADSIYLAKQPITQDEYDIYVQLLTKDGCGSPLPMSTFMAP